MRRWRVPCCRSDRMRRVLTIVLLIASTSAVARPRRVLKGESGQRVDPRAIWKALKRSAPDAAHRSHALGHFLENTSGDYQENTAELLDVSKNDLVRYLSGSQWKRSAKGPGLRNALGVHVPGPQLVRRYLERIDKGESEFE